MPAKLSDPDLSRRPVLVVADTLCEIAWLCACVVAELEDARTHVVVTTSLRIGRLQSPSSCGAQQLGRAVRRRDEVLRRLSGERIAATGLVGDPDPLLAVGDVLAGLNEERNAQPKILVVTDSADPSDWREHRLAERLEAAHGLEVTWRFADRDVAVSGPPGVSRRSAYPEATTHPSSIPKEQT
jgi:hypothetical protein